MTIELANGARLAPLTIRPVNSAAASKGSIHDDEKAKEMGYRGGLVPGVTVLGYMTRMMQVSFGEQWMSGSNFSGRLKRPVYEGADVTVEGTIVESPSAANGGKVVVELQVVTPEGAVAALGQASCKVLGP